MKNQALWYVDKGRAALREVVQEPLSAGYVAVRAHYSGVSRGTERLVLSGRVPASEHLRMRCPYQEGAFSFPVKYGYALAGTIEDGPPDRIGQSVFVLHPHQNLAHVKSGDAHALPEGLPLRRAVLTANMETALTILWDACVQPGDKVLVVGAGVVGLLVTALAARIPATDVTAVDVLDGRRAAVERLGARFALPESAPAGQDVVIHTSATEAGLRLALICAGFEAKIVEASWYGDAQVSLALGEAFHARRLHIVSSQVGAVPPSRRPRWDPRRRLDTAMTLLQDHAFDMMITGEISFDDAPSLLPGVLTASDGLMTVLRYP